MPLSRISVFISPKKSEKFTISVQTNGMDTVREDMESKNL